MKKNLLFSLTVLLVLISAAAVAQMKQDTVYKNRGQLWGVGFGDIAYKAKADEFNRGGTNQYTGIAKNQSMFQFRRIYLGYDYNISRRFTSEFLVALEDNGVTTATTPQVTSGDLLSNGRYGLFIKTASVTWNNIFKNHNLTLGQMFTPATVLTTEVVWDYRCIERTISEMRRTPAWDLGLRLNGTLYNSSKAEVGYYLMVGNGTGSKPENNKFKWFYGDVYAKLFNKRLILDLYADYNRMDWTSAWHHDRRMIKGMVAWSTPKFTAGVEVFNTKLALDNVGMKADSSTVKRDTRAMNYSIFARGRLYKDLLGFFVRYDGFDPGKNNDNASFIKYTASTSNYDPNTKENFFTAGLDFTPNSNIHIMPNVWYTKYTDEGPAKRSSGTDVVYRLSIYYVYGK